MPQGARTKSTHPVWMALLGIPKKEAEFSSSAKVTPPASLIARMPFAPSDPLPERITPMTLGLLFFALHNFFDGKCRPLGENFR
jgi:hypothetical protein